MMPGPSEAKNELRARMRARLANLPPAARQERTARLLARLLATERWRAAQSVLLFAPLSVEPDLDQLWLDGTKLADKHVFYPRMDGRRLVACAVSAPAHELRPIRWGLREPASDAPTTALAEIGLALIPGLAFTAAGSRLGRGGGFYDRLLAEPDFRAHTVGLCFDFQLLPSLPLEAHDAAVGEVLTD
ncbi:MAG: 5-formyltetrahydrofolate cyclo-ligase [Verrucomicrobia bacterium]|nr:5-formyltetrahydrofolate cyclo-ligase [Verrucomicrobiota bacterium]MBV9658114.1 5-formyltetrahydrofolate cyclo-ligase [Verrucomicrobiota bacterium]